MRRPSDLPLATYQTGGEFAMIKFVAEAGAIDDSPTPSERSPP
ncbi:hypothetical protein GJ698_10840 [Pseudoduganella sp. FT26W]|uniref:Uncharacterized protein n=1 Tax=Duganella aquatilis TaxID=2666082 RepID=A0A844D0V1_9BURK|nr:hypothetical protein [Duganella aquatilis]